MVVRARRRPSDRIQAARFAKVLISELLTFCLPHEMTRKVAVEKKSQMRGREVKRNSEKEENR